MKTFCKLFFQKLCLFMLSILSSQLFAVDYVVPYNPLDATVNIQAGIDSGADKIILEYQGAGTKWISGPLFLKSNIELYLEPGVIL